MKNNPAYSISEGGMLFTHTGTELLIKPLLSGIRQLSGEKIQNYLASELRDRIGRTGVKIKITDHAARREYIVVPRKFQGLLLHGLPEVKNPLGDVYYELYLAEPSTENRVGLYKSGTRVLSSITEIDQFNCFPWTSGYLEGIIDASFLQLTPGTRDGIVYDSSFDSFCISMENLTEALTEKIDSQKKAEDEKASRSILQKIIKALKEALTFLPENEYEWLNIKNYRKTEIVKEDDSSGGMGNDMEPIYIAREAGNSGSEKEAEMFGFPGELHSAVVSPGSSVIGVGEKKRLSLTAKDKNGNKLESGFEVQWKLSEGAGQLSEKTGMFTEYSAPPEPCIARIEALVQVEEKTLSAECVITVTQELLPGDEKRKDSGSRKGLPGYTFLKASGELWRSRFDAERAIIVINNGHADFIYASKTPLRKLRYITRLFAKELVLENFPEANKEQLLERMIELQLYAEESLK